MKSQSAFSCHMMAAAGSRKCHAILGVPQVDGRGRWVLECASVMVRAAERIVGAILCEGGLGARPQKILRFYML